MLVLRRVVVFLAVVLLVVQHNLSADTKARHENEFERCGTFPKWPGDPGISHLIAEAYPRVTTQTEWWAKQRETRESAE